MSAESPSDESETHHQVIRLARHGMLLAKSSCFTRAAAILHTTDVEIETDGVHDLGSIADETTGGVGFASAATKLDQIFQKDHVARKSGTPPPLLTPALPPLPETKIFSSVTRHSAPQPPGTFPRGLVATSSVSSDGSNIIEATVQQRPPAVASQPSPAAAPPLEGMFIRSATRHRRLIKTKLSDLPEDLQQQEPQVRGGVAIFKITDALNREKHGSMVEINAIDYIEKLKEANNDLERTVSVLRGKLENERRDRLPQTRQNRRSSLRMGTFTCKHSKKAEERSNKRIANGALRGKTMANFGKHGQGLTALHGKDSRSSGIGAVRVESGSVHAKPRKKELKYQKDLSPTQDISFPNGFAAKSKASASRQTDPASSLVPPGTQGGRSTSSSSHIHGNTPLIGQNAVQTKSIEGKATQGALSYRINSDNASTSTRRAQSQSSADEDTVPAKRQLSEPPSSGSGIKLVTPISKDQPRTFQPRRDSPLDRNSSPMPGVARRTRTVGTVGRTRSFSSMLGDIRKKGEDVGKSDKASRTLSMHRQSNATPPPSKPGNIKSTSRRRGVRKLLGLR